MDKRTKILLFLLITISMASCKRDEPLFEIHNLNGNKISCFGHGGMGVKFEYPCDTYESFEPVLRIGADGTEMNVQMTKDSVLVAYHNGDLNEGTTCSGTINDKLWSEIWGCHHVSPISSSLSLLSLNDLFTKLTNTEKFTYTFDTKLYSNDIDQVGYKNKFANAIIRFKNDHNLRDDQLLIESTDSTFLRILKNKNSQLSLFIYPNSFDDGMRISDVLHLYGITISNNDITTQQLEQAHSKGYRVTVWNTLNDKDNTNAIYKSPDFIQSDDIIHLLKVFGKYKQ